MLTSLSLNKITIVLVSKVRQNNGGWLGFNSKMPRILNESLPIYRGICIDEEDVLINQNCENKKVYGIQG